MSSAPFWLRNSGGCAATDPVVDVTGVKAAASYAEPRVGEQPPQIGAADRLLVAADELGDVERRQQAVRQFAQSCVPHLVAVSSPSFPSGHSTMSTAAFLTLAMLVASLEMKRRSKALAYALAGAVMVGVGFSRVYLGVHWPSDVLAGWCLGSAWALAGWLALRAMGGQTRGNG